MAESSGRVSDPGNRPEAYFLTFTCYGSWLHGDDRGSVDRHHRGYDSPSIDPNAALRRFDLRWRRGDEVRLGSRRRTIVEDTIRETCKLAGWGLYAINVRTNHVHVVVAAAKTPEQVLASLKSWCTRRLREAGEVAGSTRVWTRHGSTRYLWTEEDVERVCLYVTEGQGVDLHPGADLKRSRPLH